MPKTSKKNVRVGIVDYGMGNLHSVTKALASTGANVAVSDDRSSLENSDLLVVPGVGSFGAAMENLDKKNLTGFIRSWIKEDRPYLGICLGLQLLFDSSEEDPGVRGLGALSGRVVRFQKKDFKKERFTIPHMGWNLAQRKKSARPAYFKGISAEDRFYFVHTYYAVPDDSKDVCTTTDYGSTFCSAVSRKNLFATQFHLEKSGSVGLKLLNNIVGALNS